MESEIRLVESSERLFVLSGFIIASGIFLKFSLNVVMMEL